MRARRRVAVAISLAVAMRHHVDIYAGIHRFAREQGDWDYELDPFLNRGRVEQHEAYDGIVGRATRALVARAARGRTPLVNVWSGSPVAARVPSVIADNAAAGRMAAEHLISRGYRRFAFQGLVRHAGAHEAGRAFVATVQEAGFSCTTLRISPTCDETPRAWDRHVASIAAWIATWRRPVGVFAPTDLSCRYLANACRRAGLSIPEDAALVGLGNEPLICEHPEPSLTSVDVGFERIGYEAAALLERLMSGGRRLDDTIVVPPKELVPRRSTDLCLVDDDTVAAALRFIAEHSHEKIGVTDVARHACAAVRSLERHFRDVLGRTVKDEITRLRMERAKRLLVAADQPIKAVARASGFSGATYFHEAFLRVEGMTPGQYRALHAGR